MESIYNLSEDDFKLYLNNLGEKPFRAKQIMEWVYRHKIQSFDEMTNVKKSFIEQLKNDFSLDLLEVVTHQVSSDGTQKFLFRLHDGNLIESVLMNNEYGYSICVTTQVGCNMGCVFCASGMKKKLRNLETAEIVMQLLTVEKVTGIKITHIVIMGIGEPFDNYDNVTRFMKIVNYPLGLEIGARHITVSTSGLIPKIREFADFDLQVNLAISLHAPNNDIRNNIMAVNKSYPIEDLIDAIKYYIDKTNRRVTIEYILLKDINDSRANANELADLLHGLNVYVNLIPYNEVIEKPYKRSTKESMQAFFDQLKKRRINVQLRREQGGDIDAACGQLRSKQMKKEESI
ncbi:MAG: 23S rRNA (adenine(2503)-C(2))-methyltransferase RlmN [Acholeplasmatales bacterium]|jgi:23S rRNA (adenine2503-C2)-methyltransferase|nr:23S rRNA (adenine(2503)-C(2))-methyltransferase RlmN [Acholeplasmatales bacterium]MBQ6782813.1 23S rRNA (adenine(2503)-C(2))-methyltransferase RlmN [Acholeplasmatales bacterium]MBR6288391.1 23S rRNA (adenine(2503)-C(2))-methyltransferase RlmN [Acholeplasmatales bacterium]